MMNDVAISRVRGATVHDMSAYMPAAESSSTLSVVAAIAHATYRHRRRISP